MKTLTSVGMAIGVSLAIAACGEIDQTAKTEKVYAGKKDERVADGKFGGDKKKWETAMSDRSRTQNEYLRTETKK
jgi:hypothetical protein